MYPFRDCPFCSSKLITTFEGYCQTTIVNSCFGCLVDDITKYTIKFIGSDQTPSECKFIMDKIYVIVDFENNVTTLYKLILNTLLADPIYINKALIFDLLNYDQAVKKLNKYLLLS